jgi:uncharacterized protein YecT (DUF1311 family)
VRLAGVLGLAVILPAAAQLPPECRGETTAEMRICLGARLSAATAKMERYLDAARKAARPELQLDAVHRSWLQYRDIACRDAARVYEGGSLAPVVALQCRLDLTEERTLSIWRAYLANEEALPRP